MQNTDPRSLKSELPPEPELMHDPSLSGPPGEFFDPEDFDQSEQEPRPFRPPSRRRMLLAGSIVAALIAMTLLPPLVNMNHFRRQIASSISASLGRPVHMDSVTLNVLPMPGFTLGNFIVSEDPAFGSEPVIRANSVRATLRAASLWRRRVEFSRISLDEASVNLVHRGDGRWNVESILLQASRMQAAPTAQAGAGDAPRFPYIEATGARVNIKNGLEKLPISFTEARFALWLPQPETWRVRLEAHPTRTDTAATDNGLLRLEGTLGRATALTEVPIDLQGEWSAAPLGAVTRVLTGRDAGMRGQMRLSANVRGTVGRNALETRLQISNLRRAEFVPARTLDVDLACTARALSLFHALAEVRCAWPSTAVDAGMLLTGTVPDVLHPTTATGRAALKDVPASALLDALRIASPRLDGNLAASGSLSGAFIYPLPDPSAPVAPAQQDAEFNLSKARLTLADRAPFLDGDVSAVLARQALQLRPVPLNLGGNQPAILEGRIDQTGWTMHLTGSVLRGRLLELAQSLPQFGDGLETALPPPPSPAALPEAPLRVDLLSSRPWGGGQTWTEVTPGRSAATRPRRHVR